jgi:glucans biosynthesis protein
MNLTRRELLHAFAGVASISPLTLARAGTASGPTLARPEPFSFDLLRERASELARRDFQPTPARAGDVLEGVDYDAFQKIRYRPDRALWAEAPHKMPVEFFHLNRYTKKPVTIYLLQDGKARQVRYSPRLFDYGGTGLGSRLEPDLGFAGFRALNPEGEEGDWLAFMGASYFRSSGALNQYGLSARGIAVNTAVPGTQEEFPRFTALWLEQPQDREARLTVYALLDGESLTGAYRFDCRKDDGVVMDIEAELFQRQDIPELGMAPLTSMYWYSETNRRRGSDWRPEIHDSDGLAIWTGSGERIWRPLNNPPHVQTNTFLDRNPAGFGLLQRDRDFDHYQDDGVFYDRRPSVWIEPEDDWGEGEIHLVEMPTDDEIHDNIVVFWVPEKPADKGTQWNLKYRLHWVAEEPYPPTSARVVATRVGRAGVPGQHEKRPPNGRKFVIDFTGGPLATMEQRYDLDVVVDASRGTIENPYALKVVGTDRWRAVFDLLADGDEPVDLRCYLRLDGRALTETWIYQYFPGNYGVQV